MCERLFRRLGAALLIVVAAGPWATADDSWPERTSVEIVDGRWHINGQITYPGAPAEGLLMNVRMVNATFEDRNRPRFDAAENTEEFLDALSEYRAAGVLAFTLCLQGGGPGYEGALNSAFRADGSLRVGYLERIDQVIDACDRAGMVVILGCYYQRQDQLLVDDDAIRSGVRAVARWIDARGYRNVLLEIANEYPHGGFDHEIIRESAGQVELMALARREAPELLVSTSGLGNGRVDRQVAEAADFLLIHFNGTPLEEIADRVSALRAFGKPVVCNEDDKQGEAAANAAAACVAHGASYGLMLEQVNQTFPFRFGGPADDAAVYDRFRQLTGQAD